MADPTPTPAHYRKPGFFTQKVFNPFVAFLTQVHASSASINAASGSVMNMAE